MIEIKRLKDYILIIRNTLVEYEIYYIEIQYNKSCEKYVCVINEWKNKAY